MMRRMFLVLLVLALPTLACNLSESPTAVPTVPPALPLQNPVVGLNPVSGAPGTVVAVVAAGFPAGSRVNLYLSPIDTTTPNPVAQDLTIGANGTLTFALQVPDQLGNKTLSGTTPVNFMVATTDNALRANAIFIVTAGGATPTSPSDITGTVSGQLYITSPAIGAVITGGSVVVTGSGRAFNNRVGVQVLDTRNNILGSAFATIQAAAGAIGPWQTTVVFAQPASATTGYIVAYTANAQGGLADQASIPVTLAGAGVPTTTALPPTVPPTVAPTVPPVITIGPTATRGNPTAPFITSTP
jgi:Immunoglobulin-like domain of bacterial spore germination